jgi:hypothetical protein
VNREDAKAQCQELSPRRALAWRRRATDRTGTLRARTDRRRLEGAVSSSTFFSLDALEEGTREGSEAR